MYCETKGVLIGFWLCVFEVIVSKRFMHRLLSTQCPQQSIIFNLRLSLYLLYSPSLSYLILLSHLLALLYILNSWPLSLSLPHFLRCWMRPPPPSRPLSISLSFYASSRRGFPLPSMFLFFPLIPLALLLSLPFIEGNIELWGFLFF